MNFVVLVAMVRLLHICACLMLVWVITDAAVKNAKYGMESVHVTNAMHGMYCAIHRT